MTDITFTEDSIENVNNITTITILNFMVFDYTFGQVFAL